MGSYPELKNKSVIVTGAGRGIGLAIARRFVEEGSRVMLTDIHKGQAEEVISLAKKTGGQAIYRDVDVSLKRQVDEMIDAAAEAFGQLDVMINNAGIRSEERRVGKECRSRWSPYH